MTRSENMERTPADAHCTTCACVPGMTPAVRFDTTPAEKDGAVRDHLVRMGWTPPAEAQPRGRGCGDHDHASYIPGCGLCAATLPEKRMAALSREHGSVQEMFNPSAPVGVVEALSELVDLMQGVIDGEYKPDSFTLQPARAALAAQQPAAVDGALEEAVRALAKEWRADIAASDMSARADRRNTKPKHFLRDLEKLLKRHDGQRDDQQPTAVDGAMVSRFLEAFRNTDGDEAIDADEKVAHRWLTAALAAQQPATETDPAPCPVCLGFCGDSGATCSERMEVRA